MRWPGGDSYLMWCSSDRRGSVAAAPKKRSAAEAGMPKYPGAGRDRPLRVGTPSIGMRLTPIAQRPKLSNRRRLRVSDPLRATAAQRPVLNNVVVSVALGALCGKNRRAAPNRTTRTMHRLQTHHAAEPASAPRAF